MFQKAQRLTQQIVGKPNQIVGTRAPGPEGTYTACIEVLRDGRHPPTVTIVQRGIAMRFGRDEWLSIVKSADEMLTSKTEGAEDA